MTFLVGLIGLILGFLVIYGTGRIVLRVVNGKWYLHDLSHHFFSFFAGLLVWFILFGIYAMIMTIGNNLLN
jgi:hypothetical protein